MELFLPNCYATLPELNPEVVSTKLQGDYTGLNTGNGKTKQPGLTLLAWFLSISGVEFGVASEKEVMPNPVVECFL